MLSKRGKNYAEEGSIIVALSVIMILTGLAIAVLSRTMAAQDSAQDHQAFNAALGGGDAGVADALLRIDQFGTSTPPSQFCVGASASCSATSVPGSPGTQYVATYDSASDVITVRSKGTSSGRTHSVEARIKRTFLFPFAIFGKSELRFNGNSAGNVYTVDASGVTVSSPMAVAGSNGTIECKGGGGGQKNTVYPGGNVDVACNNPTYLDSGSYNPLPPVAQADCSTVPKNTPKQPCYPGTVENCPAVAGVLPKTLVPGQYLCRTSVRFQSGVTEVSSSSTNGGVVDLFVIPSSGTANVLFDDDANINFDDKNTASTSDDTEGDPTKLRVYLSGAGLFEPDKGGAHAGTFVGIAYAPQASMTSNGCKEIWRGSILFNTLTCNGGPNLTVKYDTRVAALTDQNWAVANYYEIASSKVVLP
jgi:hypothetical protein